MKFSILTPSFNYAEYLPQAIASVARQSCDVEHIVMDGNSTDGTVEVLRGAPPTVQWRSEPDRGQSDALNKALRIASGDVIGWLNADDYYLPGALDRVAEVFLRNRDIDVVHGDCLFVNAHGQFLRYLAGYHTPRSVLAYRGCVIPSTASFFRRDALGVDPWDPELRVVMDWDLFLRLKEARCRFRHLRAPLACFRLHEGQVTHALSDRKSEEHALVRERWDALPNHPGLAQTVGDLEHRILKILSGAKFKELAAVRRVRSIP